MLRWIIFIIVIVTSIIFLLFCGFIDRLWGWSWCLWLSWLWCLRWWFRKEILIVLLQSLLILNCEMCLLIACLLLTSFLSFMQALESFTADCSCTISQLDRYTWFRLWLDWRLMTWRMGVWIGSKLNPKQIFLFCWFWNYLINFVGESSNQTLFVFLLQMCFNFLFLLNLNWFISENLTCFNFVFWIKDIWQNSCLLPND